jgi:AcrR family transcriptional regulator
VSTYLLIIVARPMENTDEQLLEAAQRELITEGPDGFTLAKAATRAGVSAATLIKRFGSKEELFLRLSQRWVDTLDQRLTECAAAHTSPLARFRAVALYSYHDLDRSDTAANQLAALAIDLQHDERRRLLHVGWGHVRRQLERHATDAAAAGELTGAPARRLARLVQSAMEGGALTWSVQPRGSLVRRLRADLDLLLSPWQRRDDHE